jgi:hypothetical protein
MSTDDSSDLFLAAVASKIDFASGSRSSINRYLQCAIEGEGFYAEHSRALVSASLPIFVYLRDHVNFMLSAASYREGLDLARLIPLLDDLPRHVAQPIHTFLHGIPGYLQAMNGEGLSVQHEFGRQYANRAMHLVRVLSILESKQEAMAHELGSGFQPMPRADLLVTA